MKNFTICFYIKQTIRLSLLLAFFTSCVNNIKNEDPSTDGEGNLPILLSVKVADSPSQITGDNFKENDEIGLFIMNQPNKIHEERHIDNIRFIYDTDDGFKPEKAVFFSEDNTLSDIIAYYPYIKEGISENESTMQIKTHTNQEANKAFGQSDFLVATCNNLSPSGEPVNLIFKHKLYRIDIQLKAKNGYTIEELFELNPEIKIKDIYTKSSYDFYDESFNNLNTIADITPNGQWTISENILKGKSAILIPQTLTSQHVFIELNINGRYYQYELPEEYTLNSGYAEEICIILEGTNEAVKCVLNTSIDGWNNIKKDDVTATEVSSYIDVSNLTFDSSNIYQVNSKGEQVAEICKEYLLSKEIDAQAIVIYPVTNGKTDLGNGLVLQLIGQTETVHGGSIQWDITNNSFTYTKGNSSPINYIYISEEGEITPSRPGKALQLQIKPDILTDSRDTETILYPLVKIGTQYWMRGNLKTTRYRDGSAIPLGSDFTSPAAKYCKTTNYFFYNSAAIAANELAPEGWRISTSTDWTQLETYINRQASPLKNGTSWAASQYPITNLSGFNAVATGYFNDTYKFKKEHCSFWATNDQLPKETERSVIISYNSNTIHTSGNDENLGLSIRCIKN